MAQDSIILPEISADNFEHAWKRFRLAAVAKQWQADKQLLILPTLLRGNLVDYYMDLGEDEKRSLEDVKQALERKAGIKKDPILAARYFNSRYQDDRESVMDYATQLRKSFKEAYPEEDVGSAVLLQTFLSGLRPSIARQVIFERSSYVRRRWRQGEGTLVSYAERKVIGKGSVLETSTGQHRRWTGAGAKGSSPPNIQASQQVTCTITSLRIQYL